jgi:hypothetical protein
MTAPASECQMALHQQAIEQARRTKKGSRPFERTAPPIPIEIFFYASAISILRGLAGPTLGRVTRNTP